MNAWDMTLYVVKHKDWDGKIGYWNFFRIVGLRQENLMQIV